MDLNSMAMILDMETMIFCASLKLPVLKEDEKNWWDDEQATFMDTISSEHKDVWVDV